MIHWRNYEAYSSFTLWAIWNLLVYYKRHFCLLTNNDDLLLDIFPVTNLFQSILLFQSHLLMSKDHLNSLWWGLILKDSQTLSQVKSFEELIHKKCSCYSFYLSQLRRIVEISYFLQDCFEVLVFRCSCDLAIWWKSFIKKSGLYKCQLAW